MVHIFGAVCHWAHLSLFSHFLPPPLALLYYIVGTMLSVIVFSVLVVHKNRRFIEVCHFQFLEFGWKVHCDLRSSQIAKDSVER